MGGQKTRVPNAFNYRIPPGIFHRSEKTLPWAYRSARRGLAAPWPGAVCTAPVGAAQPGVPASAGPVAGQPARPALRVAGQLHRGLLPLPVDGAEVVAGSVRTAAAAARV